MQGMTAWRAELCDAKRPFAAADRKISFQLVRLTSILLVDSGDDSDRLEARPSESGKMPDLRLSILPVEMLLQFVSFMIP